MKKTSYAWIVLAAGVIASITAANLVRLDLQSEEGEKLAHAADLIKLQIRERLESHELILRSAAGLFAASASVSRSEWKAFVDTVRPEDIVPGVQGIGFSQIVPKQELDAHIAGIRAEGFSTFTVSPAGDRSIYSSIIYLEPFRDRNLRAFGYDMLSEPVRRAAMTQARDTGKTALSGKVRLVQETEGEEPQPGALMYVPVYRRNMPVGTPEQRQAALAGWAYSPFRMNDLMINMLREWKGVIGDSLHLTLYDGGDFKSDAVLFSTSSKLSQHENHHTHQHRIIDFNGHQWLMALDHSPAPSSLGYAQVWLTLTGGLIISGLLFWLLNALIHTGQNAERIAEQLTADMRKKDQLLRESEYRWKFALEGSDLGVWDWNIADNTVFFSKHWKEMLGFSESEISNSLDEWSKRIHPDDLQRVMDMAQAYLDGKQPDYDCEHRVQCKDGSYKWIRDRGIVVSRDDNGKPLRMIGTHADVTERMQFIQALRQREAQLEEAQRIARVGSFQVDMASGHVTWSTELYRMFGLDPQSLPPDLEKHRHLLSGESWERLSTALARAQNDGTPYELELEFIASDGTHGWMLARGEATREADGRITKISGAAADITERKRAEQALKTSGELLRSVIENVPIRIFWKDAELRYLGCNRAFANDAGMSHPKDVLGKDDFQMSWREQAGLYQADDRRVMDSGIPKLGYEEPLTKPDGRTIWLRTSKVPLHDQDGKIFGILGAYEDITQDKESEFNIRRLTSLYAALSECNAAVIHCTSQEELFKRFCEVVVDLGGVAMAWIGLTDTSGRIVPVASYGSDLEYLKQINVTTDASEEHGRGPTGTATRENRAIWVDDFRTSAITKLWQHRASSHGWLSSAALPICRDGRPVGALTFYSKETGGWHNEQTRDLLGKMASAISYALDKFAATAEARSSQATLVESEQRFRTMVEQSIAGAFIIQGDTFVYVNPRLEQILGYPVGDGLVGQPPLSIVADKDRNLAAQQLRKLLDSDARSTNFTFTAVRRDGSRAEVGVSLAKAQFQQHPALIGLMQDISDRKVAEEQISRYAKQLEHAFMQMVTLATTLSEMRDAYTAGHEKRVSEIAVAIGTEMGLDAERLEGLKVGGYLHDVGKVSIPSEILAKPGRLSPIEFELIKSHAQAGYDVLKDIEFPWPVAQIALQHHERLDGSGYPNGLKGDQIILEARILAIADVVESMASHRPYRAALGIDRALAEIERGSGSLYDPEIVKICIRLFREKNYQLPV